MLAVRSQEPGGRAWNPCQTATGGNRYVIGFESASYRPLEFGDRTVKVGLSLKLAAPGSDEFGLALLDEIKGRRAGLKLSLFAGKQLLGRESGRGGRLKACLG